MRWFYAVEIARGLASVLEEPIDLKTSLLSPEEYQCTIDPFYPYIGITKNGDTETNHFLENADHVCSLDWEIVDFNSHKQKFFDKAHIIEDVEDLMRACHCDGVFV